MSYKYWYLEKSYKTRRREVSDLFADLKWNYQRHWLSEHIKNSHSIYHGSRPGAYCKQCFHIMKFFRIRANRLRELGVPENEIRKGLPLGYLARIKHMPE